MPLLSRSFGLRTEILLTLVLLLGAALLLGGVFMLRVMEKNLLEQRISQLEIVSSLTTQSLAAATFTEGRQTLNRLDLQYSGINWWWYDSRGKLSDFSDTSEIKSTLPEMRHILQAQASNLTQQYVFFSSGLARFSNKNSFVRFIVPYKSKKQADGVLVFDYSLRIIHEKLSALQKLVLIYVVLYGVVLVGAGYFLLERNIIRPARALLKATQNVKAGDLDTRLPEFGPVEITNLSASYNQMVEALATSRKETEQYIQSLETTNQKLRQTQDQLIQSEKMGSVGQLAAGLAHELGNPLAALIGYLELLKLKVVNSDDHDLLERSLVETSRIDVLIRELLSFSRPVENGSVESVLINEELDYCSTLLINQGAFKNIALLKKYTPHPTPVMCVRHRIRQVFINLLLNAAQACEDNGEISLETGSDHSAFWIEIQDNGCGIPENIQKKIFEPFFSTKEPGKGTGLGLFICQQVVSEADGRLSVTSTLGKGSVFRIVFPVG